MGLGPYLAHNGVDYECLICERAFISVESLYAHCRQTSQHLWCEKCCRVFVSNSSKLAHLRTSRRHHVYHLVDIHHVCLDCNLHHKSALELQDHDVSQHYLCVICDNYFDNENDLQMHQQRHQARTMECYGCYRSFKSFSGMLIHLEAGNCLSGVTEGKMDSIAHEFHRSWKYIVSEDGGWLYKCPSCEKEFSKLSALFQHVEDIPMCSFLSRGHGCLAELERFVARSLE
ncbi:uncharacterized protein BO97DRAFT_401671 [Aspergillus homomorphus CBS 101889]|uniref:C2H2-type domain-containing protein n=1 Tax=Aspergillus homomorphus (strain CBS 101889) TaxID=1450537 RepID=A0A395HHG5_ASPHC|nr:hypothetical protein BO97DRAFT_401671 [Aspergillus homomorphus CBS 101889]RAL06605.1 hypothetical protein BO97DRAFT_401671 [Aspergillus homomorphus CBS 101889]